MFLLLVACGSLYLLLGDVTEGLMLLGFVFVIMGIEFSQEKKTEKALDALKDLASPRALVIREGNEIRIAGREVVTGDIVIVQEETGCLLMLLYCRVLTWLQMSHSSQGNLCL